MRSILFMIILCYSCSSIDNATDRISTSIKNETKMENDSIIKSTSDNEIVVKKSKTILDSDGDGIADNIDKCPNEKGTIENFGCKKEVVIRKENNESKSKSIPTKKEKQKINNSSSNRDLDIKSKIIEKEAKYELD